VIDRAGSHPEVTMNWKLHEGDITQAPAEVVCTSTNPNLELMAGTGGAIRDTGGWVIQDECKAIIAEETRRNGHRWLTMGTAVRTGAGTLPFRAVIHCVAIDPFHESSEEIIADCTRNALKVARELLPPIRSIAMPVFATGNGLFNFESSLRAMLGVIRADADPEPEVHIIVRETQHIEIVRSMLASPRDR